MPGASDPPGACDLRAGNRCIASKRTLMPIVEAHPNRQADRMGIGALDRALERAGRHHPAGAGAKILADLCSPYASVAEGIAAAVAMRKQGRRAAAVALAAFLKEATLYRNKTVAIIICGGNVSPKVLQDSQ